MTQQEIIMNLTEKYLPHIINLRRTIHKHPELSNEEQDTAALLASELKALGFDVRENIAGGYGVSALLKGNHPGPTVALRTDMDALAVQEDTGLSFASETEGKMHACGHDAHMAILIGTASVLADMKPAIRGNILFICQPAEENAPTGGAKAIVAAGLLDGVAAVYGLHVWPALPTGTVGVRTGPVMAASDHVVIIIKGKSAHAAMPHKGIDALVAAAQFITAVQDSISRQIDPLCPAVLTFGKICGGTRYNIIADEVVLEGTCRTYNKETQDTIEKHIADILSGLDLMYGTTSTLVYERGYAAVVNTPQEASLAAQAVIGQLGQAALVEPPEPAMTAEDFSGYLQKYAGAFLWLGATAPGDTVYPLHSDKFAADENCLSVGIQCMTALILASLSMHNQN